MERLSQQVTAYVAWKRELMREITRYRSWLIHNRLNSDAVEAKLERALKLLRTDHITLAFVGEYSRGKTELINSLFFSEYGQRMLPSQAGRTTMCPTELFFDPQTHTVRGVAMNPIDHPHGGGEGRTSGGRHPVTPWGQPTRGFKTRNNKRTDQYIATPRSKNK